MSLFDWLNHPWKHKSIPEPEAKPEPGCKFPEHMGPCDCQSPRMRVICGECGKATYPARDQQDMVRYHEALKAIEHTSGYHHGLPPERIMQMIAFQALHPDAPMVPPIPTHNLLRSVPEAREELERCLRQGLAMLTAMPPNYEGRNPHHLTNLYTYSYSYTTNK